MRITMRPALTRVVSSLALAVALVPGSAAAGDEQPVAEPATVPAVDPTAVPVPAAEPAVVAEPVTADEPITGVETSARSFSDEMVTIGGSVDPRSYAHDWLVAPPGYNIGGEMRFITATSSPSGERIRMTDMALLRLHSRWTATRRIELAGAIELLAKQLDTSDEPIPQGGSLGAKIATSKSVAIAAGLSGGPTLGGDGFWGSFGTSAVHRSRIERFIAFQVGAGALATGIDQDKMSARQWQTDATLSSELIFHTPRGEWAMWGGVDMAFPVVHSDAIDPSSRLDLTVGTVYSAVKDWDLYAEFAWRDHGTTMMPETILPIADGGFDQRQIVVGIIRRFSPARGTSRWALSQNDE
jgi:hypothetical protein